MKALKLTFVAAVAVSMLAGCCSLPCKSKCYPYPLYDYSPAKVCSSPCYTGCSSCPVK